VFGFVDSIYTARKGEAKLRKAYKKPLNGLAPQPFIRQSLLKEATESIIIRLILPKSRAKDQVFF
jgi:hypothetical protein